MRSQAGGAAAAGGVLTPAAVGPTAAPQAHSLSTPFTLQNSVDGDSEETLFARLRDILASPSDTRENPQGAPLDFAFECALVQGTLELAAAADAADAQESEARQRTRVAAQAQRTDERRRARAAAKARQAAIQPPTVEQCHAAAAVTAADVTAATAAATAATTAPAIGGLAIPCDDHSSITSNEPSLRAPTDSSSDADEPMPPPPAHLPHGPPQLATLVSSTTTPVTTTPVIAPPVTASPVPAVPVPAVPVIATPISAPPAGPARRHSFKPSWAASCGCNDAACGDAACGDADAACGDAACDDAACGDAASGDAASHKSPPDKVDGKAKGAADIPVALQPAIALALQQATLAGVCIGEELQGARVTALEQELAAARADLYEAIYRGLITEMEHEVVLEATLDELYASAADGAEAALVARIKCLEQQLGGRDWLTATGKRKAAEAKVRTLVQESEADKAKLRELNDLLKVSH